MSRPYLIADDATGEIRETGVGQESALPGVLNIVVPPGCSVHPNPYGAVAGRWRWDGSQAVEMSRLEDLISQTGPGLFFIPPEVASAVRADELLEAGLTRTTFTLAGYVPVEFVWETTERATARAEARAEAILSMTSAEIDAWFDSNVTDLASARQALKRLAKLVVFLNR